MVHAPAPSQSRLTLLARAALVRLWLVCLSGFALAGALLALLPVIWRRAPVGRRLHPPRREARVIPLAPPRRANHS
ncbi:hypothetical protein [Anaeromyxobacter paludicola]|uniref:hypothetical protein n=1 Tax=Anaeromyxobacter paludicola TaxID=2918171 RepID=UPI0020BFD3B3|nr:hypothetical protein [Anaeromyxobacter paludicola]